MIRLFTHGRLALAGAALAVLLGACSSGPTDHDCRAQGYRPGSTAYDDCLKLKKRGSDDYIGSPKAGRG